MKKSKSVKKTPKTKIVDRPSKVMGLDELCGLIGLTYGDIANESYYDVFEMFAWVGFEFGIRDDKTGKYTVIMEAKV